MPCIESDFNTQWSGYTLSPSRPDLYSCVSCIPVRECWSWKCLLPRCTSKPTRALPWSRLAWKFIPLWRKRNPPQSSSPTLQVHTQACVGVCVLCLSSIGTVPVSQVLFIKTNKEHVSNLTMIIETWQSSSYLPVQPAFSLSSALGHATTATILRFKCHRLTKINRNIFISAS